MDIFNNIFAYDLNSKQKQIFNDLILSEPYFKAIATKDYNEIKNCLADMKTKYDTPVNDNHKEYKKHILYYLRYKIGLYISCFMIDDTDIFEQIYLPLLNFNMYNEKEENVIFDILSYNKKFDLLDIAIGHSIKERYIYDIPFKFDLYKEIKLREQTFQLVAILQTYKHYKRLYKLDGNEL